MSDDFPDSSVGRPNFRNLGIRRMTKAPLIGIGLFGVVVGGVIVYTAMQRADHEHAMMAVKKHKAVSSAAATSLLAGTPTHGTIPAAPPPGSPPAGGTAAASTSAAGPGIGGTKAETAQSRADTERANLIRGAWIAYIQQMIQQSNRATSRERAALTAGASVSVASASGKPGLGPLGGVASVGSGLPSVAGDPPANQAVDPPGIFSSGATGLGGIGLGAGGFGAAGQAPGLGGPSSGSGFNGQAGKSAFLGKLRGNPDYLPTMRQAPISPDVLRAGAVVPAVMVDGIDSDLPGQIIAEVSQNVYDTATGNILLIPQGSKLVGTYDSQVSQGQTRVLVAWSRIIYPDGSSLDIGSMPGADQSGYSGFHDEVNNHYFRIFGDALLLSVFSAGVQLSQPQSNGNSTYSSQQVISGALGQQLGETGQNLINRDINIQPTLKIRPGYKFDVMVTRDMVIQPWPGK